MQNIFSRFITQSITDYSNIMIIGISLSFGYFALSFNFIRVFLADRKQQEYKENAVYTIGKIQQHVGRNSAYLGYWFVTPEGKRGGNETHPNTGFFQECYKGRGHTCIGRSVVVSYLPYCPIDNSLEPDLDTSKYLHLLNTNADE